MLGVVIGFEQAAPTVQETDESVELCAILRNGTLEREAIVQFFTSDGTAMSQGGSCLPCYVNNAGAASTALYSSTSIHGNPDFCRLGLVL